MVKSPTDGSARIVRTYLDSNGDPNVDLTFDALGSTVMNTLFERAYTSEWQALQSGSTVNAEVWHGYVTQVAGTPTRASPDRLPNAGITPVVIFGTATLALVGGLFWLAWLNRRAARNRTA